MTGAVLLLGGRSEIGLAVVQELLAQAARPVVLARRPRGGAEDERLASQLRARGATGVRFVDLDAERLEGHEALVTEVFDTGVVEVAVVAFGVLGDQDAAWHDVAAAQRLMTVNATAAVGMGVALANAFRAQAAAGGPRGSIVALSSVAGVRVRRSNFVYGASKSAMDAFYRNLAVALAGEGPQVVVVRPGAVATRMVAGNPHVPFTVPPAAVGRAVGDALRRPPARGRARVVHVPPAFGPAMVLARFVPEALWRRLES